VYANSENEDQQVVHRCRQQPFADFCSEFSPLSNEADAWELYDSETSGPLPSVSVSSESCLEYQASKIYKEGDRVCTPDDSFIWECKVSECIDSSSPSSVDWFSLWRLHESIRRDQEEEPAAFLQDVKV